MEDDAMGRSIKRTRTSTAARGWSNLPSEMGGIILSRMPSLADRARFRFVCRQWRHAAKQQWRLLPPALPWLTTSHNCVFAGFPDGARHSLPVHVHARTWEAFDRWILCHVHGSDGDDHLVLRNPLLPEDTSMVLPYAEIDMLVVCPGGELVAAIGYFDDRRTRTLVFCRPGARSWLPASWPRRADCLVDIALHNGVLYALYDNGKLCAYDLGDGDPGGSVRLCIFDGDSGGPQTELETSPGFIMYFSERHYLVPSSSGGGRLLLVCSTQRDGRFNVFEATDVGDTGGWWSEVASLADDEALFVGVNASRALQTASHYGDGVRGNRIYLAGEGDNPASLGVYDMSSKTTSVIDLPHGSFIDDCTRTGSWFFPSTADL